MNQHALPKVEVPIRSGVAWIRDLLLAAPTASAGKVAEPAWPDRLVRLRGQLGLSVYESKVVLLCASAALDVSVAELCAAASGDPTRRYPTFALAMQLFEDADWQAMSAAGRLRHLRIIEMHGGSEPLIVTRLRVDERIVDMLMGLDQPDDRVVPLLIPFDSGVGDELPPSQASLADRAESELNARLQSRQPPTVELTGRCPLSRQAVAADVAGRFGLGLWRVAWPPAEHHTPGLEALLLREVMLSGAALYLDLDAGQAGGPGHDAGNGHSLSLFRETVVIVSAEMGSKGSVFARFEVEKPTIGEQRTAWSDMLEDATEETPNRLAGQFDLALPAIRRIVDAVGEAEPSAREAALWDLARQSLRPQVAELAERVQVKAGWDDLVLAAEHKVALWQMAAQVGRQYRVYEDWGFGRRINRGLGIAALFFGESGTGKTMAAEAVANAVGLDLYRVDLSAIVNKYVGETEKNLKRVFDAFDSGGAVLFFDEADALFGRRSDVKDSHDRYANIEVNYLLQRMEAHRGLVILATNRRAALDQAFLRRLRFVVKFPYPGPDERAEIWRRTFPATLGPAVRPLDYSHLARLGLSGGNIQSVALNAAFRAASEGRPIDMELVLACARSEMTKLDMPVNASEFRWEART